MKLLKLSLLLLSLLLFNLDGLASTKYNRGVSSSQLLTDAEMQRQIHKKLSETIGSFEVVAQNGIITISGYASSHEEKQEAIILSERQKGVKEVKAYIQTPSEK